MDYKELHKKYTEAYNAYKDGKGTYEVFMRLHEQLRKLDSAIGVWHRPVGNYKSAFDK